MAASLKFVEYGMLAILDELGRNIWNRCNTRWGPVWGGEITSIEFGTISVEVDEDNRELRLTACGHTMYGDLDKTPFYITTIPIGWGAHAFADWVEKVLYALR